MKSKNILIRLIDFKISILTKLKNILLSCVFIFGSLSLSGCYTQLSMFHPSPEIEEEEQFYSYSVARVRPNLSLYANDGAGTSLGMAYQLMYNRFRGFSGFGNRYNYYNPYGYGGYYNDYVTYDVIGGTYTVWIPGIKEKKQRTWTTDRSGTTTTNLNTTRTRSSNTSESSNSGGYSNSSNVSSTRSSSGSTSSSSSSSSKSAGGKRATKRN
jgi:hypothetical protein